MVYAHDDHCRGSYILDEREDPDREYYRQYACDDQQSRKDKTGYADFSLPFIPAVDHFLYIIKI